MPSLDIGCGAGFFEDTISRGHINIDILKPKQKINNFVLCDAHFLPFSKNIFDKIFIVDVIEHLENPVKVLKELNRVATKGKIILGTPNGLWLPKTIRCFTKGKYEVYFDHISTWGIAELSQLFLRCGLKNFSIISTTYKEDRKRKQLNPLIKGFLKICPKWIRGRQLVAIIKTETK